MGPLRSHAQVGSHQRYEPLSATHSGMRYEKQQGFYGYQGVGIPYARHLLSSLSWQMWISEASKHVAETALVAGSFMQRVLRVRT